MLILLFFLKGSLRVSTPRKRILEQEQSTDSTCEQDAHPQDNTDIKQHGLAAGI